MNEFTPLAESMNRLYTALLESGFDRDQAFELTKSYCSVAFMNEALRLKYEPPRRTKREITEQFRKQVAKMKEEKTE